MSDHVKSVQIDAIDPSTRIKSERGFSRLGNTTIHNEPSDETLASQVARGDSNALETLYDRYAPMVLSFTLKVVGDKPAAEDILQETFWRVWRSAATYQPKSGSFTGWLFRIARNLAIDAYRRRNVRPQIFFDANDADPVIDQTPDPDAVFFENFHENH